MSAHLKNPKREKLLKCPCCGGKAAWRPTVVAHLPHAVWCVECHLSTTWYRLQGLAVRAWNARSLDLGGVRAALREFLALAVKHAKVNVLRSKAADIAKRLEELP